MTNQQLDVAWQDAGQLTSGSGIMEHDPTEKAPRGGAPTSLGRQLLRQRMFPAETRETAIGRYVTLRFVGAGGMGQVFAAYDPVLDRKVAIKLLPAEFSGDLEQRTRLLREAQALAKLSHPNVVQVYEAGEHEGRVYIVMEFVEGQTLREWVSADDSRRPSAREILDKYIQAGRGLAAAHEAGLVHRDFKPANVLVDTEGCARVLDFGLVAGIGESESESKLGLGSADHPLALDVELTTTGTMLGTPAYMAPEQFSGAANDARADQFGFCVALFEALTGARPFSGGTVTELMLHIREGVRDRSSSTRKLSRRVAKALDRGLSSAPDQRWNSMAELLDALEPPSRLRIAALSAAVVVPLLGVTSWVVVDRYERELDASALELTAKTQEVVASVERGDRLAFEREVIAKAQRAAEVGSLARTPGRELEALALGVEVLAEYDFDRLDLPEPALRGLTTALAGIVGLAALDRPDRLVASARFSPDGSLLVTTPSQPASGQGQLEVWSTTPARRLRTIALGELDVGRRALAISSDNRLVALGSDQRCGVFDIGTGERVRELEGCTEPRFSIDGRTLFTTLVCGEGEGRHMCGVAAWSVDTWDQQWSKPISSGKFALLVHPDGQRLIVRHDHSAEEAIDLLAASSGETIDTLVRPQAGPRVYSRPIFAADHTALSGDGRKLAVVENDGEGRLSVWDLETRTSAVLDFEPTQWGWSPVRPLLSHAGDEVLIDGAGAGLTLLDSTTNKPTYLQTWGTSRGVALPFGWLAVSSGEWTELPRPYSRQAATKVDTLVASTDGRLVATVSDAGSRLWTTGEQFELARWTPPSGEKIHGFSATEIVTRDKPGTLRVYPRRGAVVATQVDAEHLGLQPFDATADAPSRLVFKVDDKLEVHQLGSDRPLCRIETSPVKGWAIRSDGRQLAVLDDAKRIHVWDVDGCRELHSHEVPDGKYMLEMAPNGTISIRTALGLTRIFTTEGGEVQIDEQCPASPAGVPETGYSQLSADGRMLLTSCSGLVPAHNPGRLWDVQTGELIRELDLRGYEMEGRFSTDGRWVLYTAGPREIAVVRVADGRELVRIPGRFYPGTPAHTHDDLLDVVISNGGTGEHALVTLPLSVEGLIAAACHVLDRSELAERVAGHCDSA